MKTELDTIFSRAGDQQVIARDLCQVLFPQIKNAYQNSTTVWSRTDHWRQARRICSYDIFPIYFLLGIPTGSISQQELNLFASSLNDTDFEQSLALLQHYVTETALWSVLLARLSDIFDRLSIDGKRNLAKVLFHWQIQGARSSARFLGFWH